MPGQLEIRLPKAYGGRTPSLTLYTWVERALGVTDEEHNLRNGRKPYSVYAYQRGRDVYGRITVATPDQLAKLCDAAGERMSFNGEWVYPELGQADFIPVEALFSNAQPRTLLRVNTETPLVFCNGGMDDPVLTKRRLFEQIKVRWECCEGQEAPIFSSNENAEIYNVNGQSQPYQAHVLRRGWSGVMDIKLRGDPERIVNGNVLLAYGEMWGIGKATTVGAGRFYITTVPRSGERRRVSK